MNNIPPKLREEIANDVFYKKCCLFNLESYCDGKIEWHHSIIYGGKQLQKKFCIVPLCASHHRRADLKATKEFIMWVVTNRATDDELVSISKAIDYIGMRERLNYKFGSYTH